MPDNQDIALPGQIPGVPFESSEDYPIHWIADTWGPIDEAKVSRLAASVREHGLAHPILLADEGGTLSVADGRHRHRACRAAGIPGRYEICTGDLIQQAVSLNADKVNRGPSQRAMAAAMLMAAAGGDRRSGSFQVANSQFEIHALAESHNIGMRSIACARTILAWCAACQDDSISRSVWAGELAVSTAAASIARNCIPSAPQNPKGKRYKKSKHILLTWKAPLFCHGAPIKSYRVYCQAGEGSFKRIWTGAETAFRHAKADPGKDYKYRVFAVNAAGQGVSFAKFKIPHVSRNSGENEWYTPPAIIEAARECMGGIDYDPASSDIAQESVKAKRYDTAETDGLNAEWGGSVWMNPPYDKSLIGLFAGKLVAGFRSGEVDQAIVLVNNATETAWAQSLLLIADCLCFPRRRVRFLDPDGNPGAPLQGQMIIGIGVGRTAFRDQFTPMGTVFDASSQR